MTTRRPYLSDISDARGELIGLPLLAWQQARIDRRPTGEPAHTDVREVFNALLYLNCTGIAWKYLPMIFRRTAPCTSPMRSGATKASSPSSTTI